MRNYSRFSSLLFFGVFVQLLSLSSSASVFKLEYSGTISSFMQGNGMGFTVGDRVEGIMQFDLANSTGDILWLNYDANYRALAGSDFVTSTISPMIGNIPGTTDDNWDQIYIHNGYLDETSNDTRTIIGVADVYHKPEPWRSFGMAIFVVLNGIDWLNGTDVPEFEFTSASPFINLADSRGDIFDDTAVLGPNGQPIGANNTAEFKLDYVKMTKIPEPNSFLLLLFGLLGLVYSRKKLSAK